jgi:hypothetical protein
MEKEQKPRDERYCAMVAILAALYDPKKLRENPHEALRSAESLITRVPKYLAANPPWGETPGEAFKSYCAKVDAENAEAETWGFLENLNEVPSEKILSFDQAVRQPWCKFNTANRLEKFLERSGYPKKYLERREITKVGWDRALKNDLERRRESDRTRKRNRRKDLERKKAELPENKAGTSGRSKGKYVD